MFWVEIGSQPQLDHMFVGLERTLQDFKFCQLKLEKNQGVIFCLAILTNYFCLL